MPTNDNMGKKFKTIFWIVLDHLRCMLTILFFAFIPLPEKKLSTNVSFQIKIYFKSLILE